MKKFSLIVLLLLLAVATTVACQNGDEKGSETTDALTDPVTDPITDPITDPVTDPVTEELGLPGPDGTLITDDALYGWFEYGGALVMRDKYEAVGTRDRMDIAMAKNEMEGFQYLLLSNKNYDDLRLEVSTMTDGNGNTLEGVVHIAYNIYVNKSDGWHPRGYTPEILMPQDDPYQGGTFDVVAKRAKTVYVQFKTDKNTVSGTYTGRLEVKQGDTVLKAHDISVKVWNVYYDEATECKAFYQYGFNAASAPGPAPDSAPDMLFAENAFEVRRQYADFMLENRLAPWTLPLKEELLYEDFELVKTYMNNPRYSLVFIQPHDREAFRKQAQIAAENGWMDKVAVWIGDEPATSDAIDEQKIYANELWEISGITKYNAAFGVEGGPGEAWMFPEEGPNILEREAEYTTLHTINAVDVIDGPVKNTIAKLRAEGHTVLWYVCGNQAKRPDLINMLTCTPGTEKRILFWQQYQNDIDGFYMFHTMWWNGYEDMWADDYEDRTFKLPRPTLDGPEGDGVMIYWHPETQEPLGSLTLEANRDGIEDFQLLRMAEYTLGKDVAMSYAERITTANNVYTKDASLLAQVRQELGDALEAALIS